MRVVKMHRVEMMAARTEIDDAGIAASLCGLDEGGHQQIGEQEMADMIGAELQLQAVAGGHVRRGHHSGIVDQQIDPVMLDQKGLGKKLDAGHLAEIAFHQLDIGIGNRLPDFDHRSLALGHVAHRNDNLRAFRRHRPRGFLTETRGPAGDHHQLAGEIDTFEHFVCGSGGAKIAAVGHGGSPLYSAYHGRLIGQ